MLHLHVRDPEIGMGSANFDEYNSPLLAAQEGRAEDDPSGGQLDLLSAHTADARAKWLDYDTRHMLTELDPEAESLRSRLARRSGT